MRLKDLIEKLESHRIDSAAGDFSVQGISCDSRKVSDNFIFVAIKGNNADGHRFIDEAIRRGAKAVIVHSSCLAGRRARLTVHSESGKKVTVIRVEDTRRALAKLAAEFYGNPSKKIKVVGITGTNGKTTVSYLIEAVLKEAGLPCAVIGTVNYRFQDKVLPSVNTTPGPIELQSMLADMVKAGVEFAIMEVSSHALDQERTAGINFSSAIFTNLTQDHLDYHKTKEEYFQAKAGLFKDTSPACFCVINNDDAYGRRIKELTSAEIITYGIDNKAEIAASRIKFDITHTEFILAAPKEKISIKTSLIGKHNVYNILAAITWALREGIDLKIIKSALEKFSLVPGRLERIACAGPFSVFVDYAHTEDALENVINTLRQLSPERIIVLFGCGGERDKTKRPKMGRVVTELADYAIITSDNPRSEEPLAIIEDIKKGIKKNNYCVVPDRKEAIKKFLSLAKAGDIVLAAGKGHEDYQALKEGKVHFDDREVIRGCLRSMNY